MNKYIQLHEERVNTLEFLMEGEFLRDMNNLESLRETWVGYYRQILHLNHEEGEVVLRMMERYNALKLTKRPFIREGIFVCSSFTWPVAMIKQASFEYWWRNAVLSMHPESNLDKKEVYELLKI